MRGAILMMTLIGASGWAGAAPVKIEGSDIVSIYADLPVVRDAENSVKMWVLLDYPKPRLFDAKRPYKSMKALAEFDCEGARTSARYLSFHSGRMAEGDVVAANSTAAEWSPIRPSTIEQKFWAFACSQN